MPGKVPVCGLNSSTRCHRVFVVILAAFNCFLRSRDELSGFTSAGSSLKLLQCKQDINLKRTWCTGLNDGASLLCLWLCFRRCVDFIPFVSYRFSSFSTIVVNHRRYFRAGESGVDAFLIVGESRGFRSVQLKTDLAAAFRVGLSSGRLAT